MYYILIKLTWLQLIGGLIYTCYLTVITRYGSKILFLPGKAVYPAVGQHTCLIPDSKPATGCVKLFFAYVNLNLWINTSQWLAQLVNLVVFALHATVLIENTCIYMKTPWLIQYVASFCLTVLSFLRWPLHETLAWNHMTFSRRSGGRFSHSFLASSSDSALLLMKTINGSGCVFPSSLRICSRSSILFAEYFISLTVK